MTLSVPASKRRDIRREAQRLLRRGTCTLRALTAFIGKAQAVTPAVFPARLKTSNLLALKNQLLHQGKTWSSTITLTPPAYLDLEWWVNHLQRWNGLSFLLETPTQEVFTDASNTGWAIVYNNTTLSGAWTPSDNSHINYRELYTIWRCVQIPELQGKTLRIYCDNNTAIAYVRHFGGTRSSRLMELAASIWEACMKTNTQLHLTYISSDLNPADSPSRPLTTLKYLRKIDK